MPARILDGKSIAAEIRAEIAQDVASWVAASGCQPTLAAILVGQDPASQVYVRNKERACQQAGIGSRLHRLDAGAGQAVLLELIQQLNEDPQVHGILVQLPLPEGYDERQVLDAVTPLKDVDAFNPENVGLLMQGRPRFLPCTPNGVLQLLHRCQIPVAGKHAVVLGRSEIVGKPMAILLAAKTGPCGPDVANATVTIAHSRSENLSEILPTADLLIAAVGRPEMVRGAHLKPGCTVIDVGINRVGDRLVGDVHWEEALAVAGAITPVPGGVGPLTIAMLLRNTLTAAKG
ncbi:bifunctional 5,10-methylenetetrahydrofolate dehydrogenase/5,10-methenyltetrahydrofolate cyclohydrolase [Planctomycetaceae bacterium SH139]